MDPYEGELSNHLAMYWCIFCVYIAFPIIFLVFVLLGGAS